MPAMTKIKLALQYLKQAGVSGIHSFELNQLLHTDRAAARIQDLKDQGYEIVSRNERMGRSWGVRYFLNYQEERKPEYRFDPGRQVYISL